MAHARWAVRLVVNRTNLLLPDGLLHENPRNEITRARPICYITNNVRSRNTYVPDDNDVVSADFAFLDEFFVYPFVRPPRDHFTPNDAYSSNTTRYDQSVCSV